MGRAANRKKQTKGSRPSDPPFLPLEDASVWYATGPEPLRRDPETAAVLIGVGMAANALTAQLELVRHLGDSKGAARMMRVLAALSTSVAYTHEACVFAHRHMRQLRQLATEAKAPPDLLKAVGRLCGGKHPASALLQQGRNELVFHWDAETVRSYSADFATNSKLIWHETGTNGLPVHRLACHVLAHALLGLRDDGRGLEREKSVANGLAAVDSAMRTMLEFFTAVTYGYFQMIGAERHQRGRSA